MKSIFHTALTGIAFLALAIVLLMKRRDILLLAALALTAIVGLLQANIIMLLMYLSLAALAAVYVLPQLENFRALAGKLWFVPGIVSLVSVIRTVANMVRYNAEFSMVFGSLIGALVGFVAILLLGKWIVNPYVNEAYEEDGYEGSANSGYISMVKHVLLMLFFGGIWLYVWIYKTTKFLNCAPDMEYRNPTNKLLLCMFVPFYYLYWVYKSAQRIDRISNEQGIPSDSASTCLILAIFIGIVPPILMQSKINSLVASL